MINTIQSVLWLVTARLLISKNIFEEILCSKCKEVTTHVFKQIEDILKYNKSADLEDIVKEYNIQMKASAHNQKII